LAEAQQEYERQRQQDRTLIDDQQRAEILSLAAHFPQLWRDPKTPDRERKRMVRLLLEDVTLLRDKEITLQLRFKGGAQRTLKLPLPLRSWELRQTSPEVVREIDRLLDEHTYPEIAEILQQRGFLSGEHVPFNARIVARIQRSYGLKSRYDRLREAGLLTAEEMSRLLGLSRSRVNIWRRHGLLRAHAYNDKSDYLYDPLGDNPPRKAQGVKLSRRSPVGQMVADRAQEVQYEA
jgi:hypothetical protein